ncbi:hypothetical protein MASR1M90_10440 [Desulfovibrionales bacterium]
MHFCKQMQEKSREWTLNDLRNGEKAVVRQVEARQRCHAGKLAAMGITPGTEVEMISNGCGPLLIAVRSSRLCVCRSLGQAVRVELIPGSTDANMDDAQT